MVHRQELDCLTCIFSYSIYIDGSLGPGSDIPFIPQFIQQLESAVGRLGYPLQIQQAETAVER